MGNLSHIKWPRDFEFLDNFIEWYKGHRPFDTRQILVWVQDPTSIYSSQEFKDYRRILQVTTKKAIEEATGEPYTPQINFGHPLEGED